MLAALAGFMASAAPAAGPRDQAVELGAAVTDSPPTVVLDWAPASTGLRITNQAIARKVMGAPAWDRAVPLDPAVVCHTDAAVRAGTVYEYQLHRQGQGAGARPVEAYGYIAAGMAVPAVHARGTAVLLVEAALAPLAEAELDRFAADLIGDGWRVIRHEVPRTSAVAEVRAVLQAEWRADPSVRTAVLLGHIPQPYSGDVCLDGHANHRGAWPADAYYADLDGEWTDRTVSNAAASDPRNRNVPGDGTFDQSSAPTPLELDVGRVDLQAMTTFAATGESELQIEARLLRRYLEKDHDWRHGRIEAPARGLVNDNFQGHAEAFGATGWRNFAALVGRAHVHEFRKQWFDVLDPEAYVLAYGCGPGQAVGCHGVGTTAEFARIPSRAVFTFLFGSYFGDWGYANSFLRAPLANEGYGLTCAWAGRPHWYIHLMGMGQTIGDSARLTANHAGELYPPGTYARHVAIGLMGDPTLRLHVVAPPAHAAAATEGSGMVVGWKASADADAPGFLGYYLYRASSLTGAWTRLTGAPLGGAPYTDAAPVPGSVYMVRAARLQPAASGTYENLSQGVFAVPGNTRPTISAIADRETGEDAWSAPARFAIGDAETPADSLWVTARASDPALVPAGNAVFAGAGADRTVSVMPGPNRHGAGFVTVTVSDGHLSASTGFTLRVRSVNDGPEPASRSLVVTNTRPASFVLSAADPDGDSMVYGLVSGPTNGVLSGTPPNLTYVFTNPPGEADRIQFTAADGLLTRTGSISLVIRYAPSITAQPRSLTNDPGTTAAFTVAAKGSVPLHYAWVRQDASNGVWQAVPDGTGATHSIVSVTSAHPGAYACRIRNSVGSVTSVTATLTVRPAPPPHTGTPSSGPGATPSTAPPGGDAGSMGPW